MDSKHSEPFNKTKEQMQQTLVSLAKSFASIRSGRANTALLESVTVSAYNQKMPLKELASLSSSDATTIAVQVWDAGNIKTVEKAIYSYDESLSIRLEGPKLFVSFPIISQERREQLIKQAQERTEQAKIALRSIRRDLNEELKKMHKDAAISDDEHKNLLKESQNLTDSYQKKAELSLETKAKEMRQI